MDMYLFTNLFIYFTKTRNTGLKEMSFLKPCLTVFQNGLCTVSTPTHSVGGCMKEEVVYHLNIAKGFLSLEIMCISSSMDCRNKSFDFVFFFYRDICLLF